MSKKVWKKVVLFSIIGAFIVTGTSVTATSKPKEIPIVLKMNDKYILYAYPKVPYIDQNNRLILPLRSSGDLLGVNINYDADTKTATISQEDHHVKLTVDSPIALVDESPVKIDLQPFVENGSMFVPARILFDSFDYDVQMGNNGIVVVNDERLLKQGEFENNLLWDKGSGRTIDPNAFQPLSYTWTTGVKDGYNYNYFSFIVKNISGSDIPEGIEGFVVHGLYENAGGWMSDYQGNLPGDRERPAVKKDGIFIDKYDNLIQGDHKLLYILASGRTITKKGE